MADIPQMFTCVVYFVNMNKSKDTTKITLSIENSISFWHHVGRNLLVSIPLALIGGALLVYGEQDINLHNSAFSISGIVLLFIASTLIFSGTWVWSILDFIFTSTSGGYTSSNQFKISDPVGIFFKNPERHIQSVRTK